MLEQVPLQLRRFSVVPYSLSDSHPIALRHTVYTEPRNDLFDLHYELEFGIVLRGTKVRQYLEQDVTLEPGQVWFHPTLEPHGCAIVEPPCELLVFVIQPEFVVASSRRGHDWMRPFDLPPARRPRAVGKARAELIRVAKRLAAYSREGRRDVEQWAEVLLFEALLLVEEESGGGGDREERTRTRLRSAIQPALSLVYAGRSHVDVTEAARACNMSAHAFASRFELSMGMSFAQFARTHRLKGAAAQLAATDDPLKLIAAEWGFRDVSHLSKCFSARYGTTPGEYRKRNLGMERTF